MSTATATAGVRTGHAISAGVAYLTRLQHGTGSWTDFYLAPGASDAWVTAYAGLALADAARSPFLDPEVRKAARSSAERAADWLLHRGRSGVGWGYRVGVRPDADSTAHTLSLLARLGRQAPEGAVQFLWDHDTGDARFRTYRAPLRVGAWKRPCADVTAAALRALHDTGALTTAELRRRWLAGIGTAQDVPGSWSGFWWATPSYPTGVCLEVWATAGRPQLRRKVAGTLPDGTAFDRAWRAFALAVRDRESTTAERGLVALQRPDGGWPGGPILRVPPAHPGGRAEVGSDARGIFTTATAVRTLALAAAPPTAPVRSSATGSVAAAQRAEHRRGVPARRPAGAPPPPSRSTAGAALDETVYRTARSAGFSAHDVAAVATLFRTLTRDSLGHGSVWPSAQLSCLASGIPLEFSATVGRGGAPALRYATEVGEPHLAPYPRAASGLEALACIADALGYGSVWSRLERAMGHLVRADLDVPDGLRFWVWGGMDHTAQGDDAPAAHTLKVYLNLLDAEVGGGRARLDDAFGAAGVPNDRRRVQALDVLDGAGYAHELGFGLAEGGRVVAKAYYELRGWDRPLVRKLLETVGLPADTDALCPQIPGVLNETLAAKSRSGIALRVDMSTGQVREVTTAAAFPPPLIPDRETAQRVRAWIHSQGWDGTPYRRLCTALLPAWEQQVAPAAARFHGLFTRTLSASGRWATVYLRPPPPSHGGTPSARRPLRADR